MVRGNLCKEWTELLEWQRWRHDKITKAYDTKVEADEAIARYTGSVLEMWSYLCPVCYKYHNDGDFAVASILDKIAKNNRKAPKERIPDLTLNVFFSSIGVQVDFLINGEEVGFICRDFKGDYGSIAQLVTELYIALGDRTLEFVREK